MTLPRDRKAEHIVVAKKQKLRRAFGSLRGAERLGVQRYEDNYNSSNQDHEENINIEK